MRPLFLILAILAANPADAKCHLFSVWHYPWPQRCFGQKRAFVRNEALAHAGPRWRGPDRARMGQDGPDIPLPSLARAELDDGAADEPTRAKVLLRAALEAANAQ